jgi:hypothetical protein
MPAAPAMVLLLDQYNACELVVQCFLTIRTLW